MRLLHGGILTLVFFFVFISLVESQALIDESFQRLDILSAYQSTAFPSHTGFSVHDNLGDWAPLGELPPQFSFVVEINDGKGHFGEQSPSADLRNHLFFHFITGRTPVRANQDH